MLKYTLMGILHEEVVLIEYTREMKNRLRRIEGQIQGVLRMMDEQKECKDIVSQLTASRNAIDRAIGLIVGSNLERCIRDQMAKGESGKDFVKEAVDLLVRSR